MGSGGVLGDIGIILARGGKGCSTEKLRGTRVRRECFPGTVDQTAWGFECLIKECSLLREWEAINSAAYCMFLFMSRRLL